MLLSDAINNDALFPPDPSEYDSRCLVKDVKITMHVTTVTGFVQLSATEDYTTPSAGVGVCGSGVGFSGCSSSGTYFFDSADPATGNQIGTNCGDFVFDTTATTPWEPSSVTPPYSGTYQWDTGIAGVGGVLGDLWRLRRIEYRLSGGGHPPDAVLECARIEVTTELEP
jgi:hypothetical protein